LIVNIYETYMNSIFTCYSKSEKVPIKQKIRLLLGFIQQ